MKRAAANGPKGPSAAKGANAPKGSSAPRGSNAPKGSAAAKGPHAPKGAEERLIYFAAVVHKTTILGAHSSVEEDYMGIVAEAMYQLPPNLSRYTRSYDGTMLAFLVADDGIIYMLGGHEAMGKERAFAFLRQLREVHIRAATNQAGVFISSLLTSPYNTALQRLSSRIKHLMGSVKGPIPKRRRLEVYPDAPRAYLTRAGITDNDYLSEAESVGEDESSGDDAAKERLKRALAEVDEEDDEEDARLASSFAGRRTAVLEGGPGSLRSGRDRGGAKVAQGGGGEDTEDEDFVWNPRPLSPNPLSDVGDDSPKISPRPRWSQQLEILREQQMGTSIALQGRDLGPAGSAADSKGRPAPVQLRSLFSSPVGPQSPINTGPLGAGLGSDKGSLLGADSGSRQGRGQGASGLGAGGRGGDRKARHRHLLNMTWSQELGYVNSQLEKVHAQRLAQAMASQGLAGGGARDAGLTKSRSGRESSVMGLRAGALGLTPLVPRGVNGALEVMGESEEEEEEEEEEREAEGEFDDDLLAATYLSKSYSVDYAAVLRRVQSATAARERLSLALQPPVYPTQGAPRAGSGRAGRSISSGRWAQGKGGMAASVVSPETDRSSNEVQLIPGYEYSDETFKKRPKFLSEEFVQGRGPASGMGPMWRGPAVEQGIALGGKQAKQKTKALPQQQRYAPGRLGDDPLALRSSTSAPRKYPKAVSMPHGPPTGVPRGELPWVGEILQDQERKGADGGRRGGAGRKAVRVVEEDLEEDSRGESDEGRGGKRREERRQLRRRARSLKEQGWGVQGGGAAGAVGAPQLRRVRPELEGDGLPPVRLHFSDIFDRPGYAQGRAPSSKRAGGPRGAKADLMAHPGDAKQGPGSSHGRTERVQSPGVRGAGGEAEANGKKGAGVPAEPGRRRTVYSDDLTYKSQLEARSRAMQGVLAAHQRGNYQGGENGDGGEQEAEKAEEEEEEFEFPILVGSRALGANRSFTGELVQRRDRGLYASVVEELEEGEEEGEEEEEEEEGGGGDVSEEEWIQRLRKTKGVMGQHDKGISLKGSSVGEGFMRVVTGEYARGPPHFDRAQSVAAPRSKLPSRFVSEEFSRSLRKTSSSQKSQNLDRGPKLQKLDKSQSQRSAGRQREEPGAKEGGAQGLHPGAPQAGQGSWVRSMSQEFSSRTAQLYQRKRSTRRRRGRERGEQSSDDGRSEGTGDTTGDEGEESDTMGVVVLPRAASEKGPLGDKVGLRSHTGAMAGRERALPMLVELSGEKSGGPSRASPAASGGVSTVSGGAGGGSGSLKGSGGHKGGPRARAPDTKVRGKILETAPSGLPWHEEIARMLAEQGVQVKAGGAGEDEEDDESAKEGPREGPRAATRAPPGAGSRLLPGGGTPAGAAPGSALRDPPSPLSRLSPSSSTSSSTAGGVPGPRPGTASAPGVHQGGASSSRASPSGGGSTHSGSPHATGAGRLLSQLASGPIEQHQQALAQAQAQSGSQPQAQSLQDSPRQPQHQHAEVAAQPVGVAAQGRASPPPPQSPGSQPSQAGQETATGPGQDDPGAPRASAAARQAQEQKSQERAPTVQPSKPAATAPRTAPPPEPEQPKACCVIL